MRALSLATVAVGSVLFLSSPVAVAQQNQGGLGGAVDTLNRTLNPDQERDQRRARDQERSRRDVSGSSEGDERGLPSYRRYSDQDLREESNRLEDESRQIERERRAVNDEISRRGMRR